MNTIISLFKRVQAIPYCICKYDEELVNETLAVGDCRHKSTLLKQLYEREGYEVRKVKVIFDWKDLPVPTEILSLLKAGTIWDHDALEVKVQNNWIKVDCTWNPELEKKGFPITKNWDGKTDTLQVTCGKLEFHNAVNYIRSQKIKVIKVEAYAFADAFNRWLQTRQ